MRLGWPLYAALLLIAAAAIAGPFWAVLVYRPTPDLLVVTKPAPRTLAKIEAMAESACRCRRADLTDGGKDDCWADFDKFVAPYGQSHDTVEVSACGAVGTERMCFPGMAWEDCIVIDTSRRGECNDEERRIVAAIWPEWERFYDDPAKQARAEKADRLAHEAFERGDKLSAPPPGGPMGCGG
jgi:hypothetical protein